MEQIITQLRALTDEEMNTLSKERKKHLKRFMSAKTQVQISSSSLKDCIRVDGLDLDVGFVEIFSSTLRIPEEIESPLPSDFLCQHLSAVQKYFVLDNEKALRMLIDAILLEVLKSDNNPGLIGSCEVPNDWEGLDWNTEETSII